jgi:hypothetical protein
VTTTHLSEDDEAWIVSIEDRVKKLEATLRNRAAVSDAAQKSAPIPAPAPAPVPSPMAAQDARIMGILRAKARKHLRTFSFDGAVSRIISGNYDEEILKIFCAPPGPSK